MNFYYTHKEEQNHVVVIAHFEANAKYREKIFLRTATTLLPISTNLF